MQMARIPVPPLAACHSKAVMQLPRAHDNVLVVHYLDQVFAGIVRPPEDHQAAGACGDQHGR